MSPFDVILGFFLFFLCLVLCICGPAAIIWLFFMRKRLENLTDQNARLEASLQRLQRDVQSDRPSGTKSGIITIEAEKPVQPPTQSAAPSPFTAEMPARPAPPPVAPFVVPPATQSPAPKKHDSGVRFRSANESRERNNVERPDEPAKNPVTPLRSVPGLHEQKESTQWELWIGQKLFGWVAVIGFIVAGALFIRYAINEGWITNTLKVAGIAGFGAGLLGIGFYCRRTGLRRFSTMMSSAGIILIYQAGYASFAFYKLIGFSTASVLMPLIVFGGFLLAWFYRSKLLGTVAILGGLAVPILVSSPDDHHREFFIYLMSLNIGTLILINLLRRAPIAWIAFFGTQALFWMWHSNNYLSHHIFPVLAFQSAFYLVYLADTVIAARKPIGKKLIPTWDDAMRAVLAPIIFFGTIYIISKSKVMLVIAAGGKALVPEDVLHAWLYSNLGIFAFIGAAWYALLAVCAIRARSVSKDENVSSLANASGSVSDTIYWQAAPSAATVIALGFVAIGIPLHFQAMWITLGWLTVFGGLWYFGHRQTNKTFVVMALIFFALGMFRFMGELLDQLGHAKTLLEMTPVFNSVALPMLAGMGVLIVAAVLAGRWMVGNRPPGDCVGDSRQEPSAEYRTLPPGGRQPTLWISNFNHFVGILGYVLLGVVLSGEAARYFYAHENLWEPYQPEYLFSAFLLAFWFTLAVLLLEIGLVFRSKAIAATAVGGLAPIAILWTIAGFAFRLEYQEAFNNPFSIVLIAESLILLAIGYQGSLGALCVNFAFSAVNFTAKDAEDAQRTQEGVIKFMKILGGFGLFSLLAILTIEWFYYFVPFAGNTPTVRSVTLFWTLYALLWITLGFVVRNMPLRVCGLIILFGTLAKTFLDSTVSWGYCSWEWGTGYDPENWTLLANPYFLTMLCPVIPAMAIATWTNRAAIFRLRWMHSAQSKDCGSDLTPPERIAWKTAGIIGLVALLIYLSIECHQFFDAVETKHWTLETPFLASTSLTVFWTIAALILTALALSFQSRALRIISMSVLGLTVLKVFADLDTRPEFTMPFLNPYALPMFIFAGVLIALGYLWTSRLTEQNRGERDVYRVLAFGGVVFLLLTMSVECYRSFAIMESNWSIKTPFLASTALTIFWTLAAMVLAAVAVSSQSKVLRIMSMLLLVLTALKIWGNLAIRPEFTMPFLNPYSLPMFVFAAVLIAVGFLYVRRLGEEDAVERGIYRVFSFAGVVFLWFTMSVECYQSVKFLLSLQEAEADQMWQAQMALSILWSLFAGILIAIGFIWRSATLRWMAIILFAGTLTKILIVDMAGVNELYRFGAVFALATLLAAATWAYQRFKP